MAKSKVPCRYTLRDGTMCSLEALMPDHETHLCMRHTVDSMNILTLGRQHRPEPTERDLRDQRDADAQTEFLQRDYRVSSVVYYIKFGDRIKIGTTVNLRQRLTALPFDKVLATERGDYALEGRRHHQFKHCRVNGEWFRGDDPKLLAHIAAVCRMTAAQRDSQWNGRAAV